MVDSEPRSEPPPPDAADRIGLELSSPAGSTPPTSATWGPGRVLSGLAILLVTIIFAAGIAAAIDPDLESLASVLILQAVLAAAMLGVSFAVAAVSGLASPGQLGLGAAHFKPFRTAAIGYLIYIGFALVLSVLLSPEQEDITRDLGVDEGTLAAIAAFLLVVIAAPIAEEVFFRGFIYAGFRRAMPFWLAAGLSGIVFGAFHVGSASAPAILQLSIFGAILAWVYERTGSIRPAIALHMLNNAIAFTVLVTT